MALLRKIYRSLLILCDRFGAVSICSYKEGARLHFVLLFAVMITVMVDQDANYYFWLTDVTRRRTATNRDFDFFVLCFAPEAAYLFQHPKTLGLTYRAPEVHFCFSIFQEM